MREILTTTHLDEVETIAGRLIELGDVAMTDGYVAEAGALYGAAREVAQAGVDALRRLRAMVQAIASDEA